MKRLAFSDPMMRAIAAGQKTMTRRIEKRADSRGTGRPGEFSHVLNCGQETILPRLRVGDLVAATCAFNSGVLPPVRYRFNHPDLLNGPDRWNTSRIMPAALAPFVLRITQVRAERLGEIKPSDAVREGMFCLQPDQAVTDTFRAVWEGLYGDGSFERDFDSWVWVYGFEIAERRIA